LKTDSLSEILIAYNLRAVLYFDSIDSTNKYAKENNLPSGSLIIAAEQTKGRGRFDREWESEKGSNILLTIVKSIRTEYPALINFYASYIVYKTLTDLYTAGDNSFALKWPNDILLDGRKICGILTELKNIKTDRKKFYIGIGINVNQLKFSESIRNKSTSLVKHFNRKSDISDLIARIIKNFCENIKLAFDYSSLTEIWRKAAKLEGKRVEFRLNDTTEAHSGVITGIKDDGAIEIESDTLVGVRKKSVYYSGEISFI
jgi:BirA family biotin operon repressor/biotin-[acetyl-CoA-carboxylase] ligase